MKDAPDNETDAGSAADGVQDITQAGGEKDIAPTGENAEQLFLTYIGISNNPVGDEANVSVEFPVSLRVFCIAFALSQLETRDPR